MDSCLILVLTLAWHAKYPFASSVSMVCPHAPLAMQAAQHHPALVLLLLLLLLTSILEGIAALSATTLA